MGENLLGGQVTIVPATEEDQVRGKEQRVYMVHYLSIMLEDGTHLVVRRMGARLRPWGGSRGGLPGGSGVQSMGPSPGGRLQRGTTIAH